MLKEFKKSDLKDGMVVENNNGALHLILNDRMCGEKGWDCLSNFKEDLTNEYHDLTIKKVYSVNKPTILNKIFEAEKLTLIWERKRQIDWNKVPEGTKVQVRDSEDEDWRNRYFNYYNPRPYSFNAWLTKPDEFTGHGYGISSRWKYCRLHPDVEIKEEWCK